MLNIKQSLKSHLSDLAIYPIIQRLYRIAWDFWINNYYLREDENSITVNTSNLRAEFVVDTPEEWRAISRRSQHEKGCVEHIVRTVDEQDVFYDIGANIGLYTCTVGQKARSVVAIEPYPPNLESLKQNIEMNNIDSTLIDQAVSDENTIVKMNIPYTIEAGAEQGSIKSDYVDQANIKKRIEVQTTRLDDLINKGIIEDPDVIKIDVEGVSPAVLRGLGRYLQGCHHVFVEPHDNHQEIKNILSNAEFSVSTLDLDRGDDIIIVGSKIKP